MSSYPYAANAEPASPDQILAVAGRWSPEGDPGQLWRTQGLCNQTDPELFFPEAKGQAPVKAAKTPSPIPISPKESLVPNRSLNHPPGVMPTA